MNIELNIIYGIIAILLWSATVALIRSITINTNAIRAGTITFMVSGIICIIYLFLFKDFSSIVKQSPRYFLICGTLFIGYMLALFIAIDRAKDNQQAMELGLVNYLWPTLTVVLSLIVFKTQINLLIIPGILLALAGIFIVITQNTSFYIKSFIRNIKSNYIAYFSALTAAVFWAAYSNLTNLLGNAKAESAVFVFIPFTGLFFILLSFMSGDWQIFKSVDRKTFIEIIVLSITTVSAYILWDVSMRNTNVTSVAMLSYFTPFLSTLVLGVYLKEKIKIKLWLGCFFIVAGSLISWYSIY